MDSENSNPRSPFDTGDVDALPAQLPIFPLPGATLLPGTQLPLNIFEPRYLNMVLDALGEGRLIGMIQPRDDVAPSGESPALYDVGCAGRIVSFAETGDGRLLITLRGVCRFRCGDALALRRGYRRVVPLWTDFSDDLHAGAPLGHSIAALQAGLDDYLRSKEVRVDWKGLQAVPAQIAVDFLAMSLPLAPDEKQLLLEARSGEDRWQKLLAVAQMAATSATGAAPVATPGEGVPPTRH